MINLRNHQKHMINETRQLLAGHNSVLMQGPTGVGKTVITASMIKSAADLGNDSMFIVHRQELVDQTIETFEQFKIPFGVIASGYTPNTHKPVQICSIQTLKNRISYLPKRPKVIFWDECHHANSTTWRAVKDFYPEAKHVGMTATPQRLDGKELGDLFDVMVLGPSVKWLIQQGFLSQYKLFRPGNAQMSFDNVGKVAGDYNRHEIADIVDRPAIIADIVETYQKNAHGKKGIYFAVNVNHSQHLAKQFCEAGYRAVHLDAKSPRFERKRIIQQYRDGEIDILTNVDLFGEGFDLPAIEVVGLCRPTQSLVIHCQQVGRALRISQGKTHAIILDHVGNTLRHENPDYDHLWELRKSKLKPQKAEYEKPARQCPKCGAFHFSAPSCPDCGHVYPVGGREVLQKEGELYEVQSNDDEIVAQEHDLKRIREARTRHTFNELIEIGKKSGQRQAWAKRIKRN